MNVYEENVLNAVTKQIASKLNAVNTKSDIFQNIAAMQCADTVNAVSLRIWADIALDYALDYELEGDYTDDQLRDFNFAELYIISQHAERIEQFLK